MKRVFVLSTMALVTGVVALVVMASPAHADCVKVAIQINGTNCVPTDQPGGPIVWYLRAIIKFMGYLVGIVLLLSAIIAGVQYIISDANPSQIKAARDRLVNVFWALLLYVLMFAILNYLIPGGILTA